MKSTQKNSSFAAITTVVMLFVFIGMLSMSFINNAQDKAKKPWDVPAKSKEVKSPVKSDDATIAKGKELYTKNCKSCHGATGKGDGPKAKELDTPTGDFTEKAFQSQTEGEMFFKASEGRDDMPSFKKKIADPNEIWSTIMYIRTLK